MGITPIYDLPYPEPTDPADVPADMEELAALLDTVINGIDSRLATVEATATTRPPVVSALPGSPVGGQEIYLQPDAGQPWLLWHLRYNAGSASPYKWEAVGRQLPIQATDPTQRTTTGSAIYGIGPTELSLVVPLAGEYFTEAKGDLGTTSASGVVIFCKAGTAVGGTDDTYAAGHGTGRIAFAHSIVPALTVAAAGGKILWLFRQSTAESGTLQRRYMQASPVRVG